MAGPSIFAEPSAGYGHAIADRPASFTTFTVTKSNPSGEKVRFTVADPKGILTTSRLLRMVLADAIQQWLVSERATLITNGDSEIADGGADPRFLGDGFAAVAWNFAGKYAEITVTDASDHSVTGDLTVSKPYADVI